MPIGRAGFIGFCPLTLVHLCRVERMLSSLPLVSIPQRHEAPLYFWCETKSMESEPHTLRTRVGLLCHLQELSSSLHLQLHAMNIHLFASRGHKMCSRVGIPEVIWNVRCPQGVARYDAGPVVSRLIWNKSYKLRGPQGAQVSTDPTSGQPDTTGPGIEAAIRSFLRWNSVLFWN